MKNILSIDVGGTEIKYNVISEDGTMLDETKTIPTPMPEGNTEEWTREKLQEAKAEYVKAIEQLVENSTHQIAGLAVSEPGFIDAHTGYIQQGGALSYMMNTNYYELFAHLNMPVVIDNDARCVAMAEYGAGGAIGLDNFACITLGTGVGAGIMVNGQLIEGSHQRGGEFGASIVGQSAEGKYQTYHETCSMSALIGRYCYAKKIDSKGVTGKMVFEDIDDPITATIIDEWYKAIAVAVFNLTTTFDCDKILLGGGVSARPDLADNVKRAIRLVLNDAMYTERYWDLIQIPVESCQFRNSSGLLGAFYRFKQLREL